MDKMQLWHRPTRTMLYTTVLALCAMRINGLPTLLPPKASEAPNAWFPAESGAQPASSQPANTLMSIVTETTVADVPSVESPETETIVPSAAAHEGETDVPSAAAHEGETDVPSVVIHEDETDVPPAVAYEGETDYHFIQTYETIPDDYPVQNFTQDHVRDENNNSMNSPDVPDTKQTSSPPNVTEAEEDIVILGEIILRDS